MEKRVKPAREGQPQPLMLVVASEVLWPKQMPQVSQGGQGGSFQAEEAGQEHC